MADKLNRWSREITEEDRHDVGGGVFASGSARDIADAVIAAARNEEDGENVERGAMAKRAVLEEAKVIVREST